MIRKADVPEWILENARQFLIESRSGSLEAPEDDEYFLIDWPELVRMVAWFGALCREATIADPHALTFTLKRSKKRFH